MHVFLISFKKEYVSKNVLLLLYCKQALCPHTLSCYPKAHGRRASLNRIFFLSMKKGCSREVMREKSILSICLSVCLSVCEWRQLNWLRLKLFEFDFIYHFKSLIQMKQWRNKRFMSKRLFPDLCSHSFFDHPSCTKTVDKKSRNRVSRLKSQFSITNPNFQMLQEINPDC